jgi:hypothetical protein
MRKPDRPKASQIFRCATCQMMLLAVDLLGPECIARTGLWQQSNQSPLPRNGNWKKASRDRRPKPASKGPKCRKLLPGDRGSPA